MEIVKQPDLQVFASEAKSGEVLKFPDILRGWGVTLEQTQGKPPLEWMNDAFKRIDVNNLYHLQQGIPEWNKAIRYPVNAIVKYADKIYLCLVENENNEPHLNSEKWTLYVKKATTAQQGIVQLTNTIDTSQDKAITPFAVNELQKAIEQAITEATEVPVDKIFAFDTATPPKGYIARNGQAIDQATMPKLYARYGANMPDDRDRVLRMAGALAGTAGSTQEDELKSHHHSDEFLENLGEAGGSVSGRTAYGKNYFSEVNPAQTYPFTGPSAGSNTLPTGGVETRVKSRIVILCNKIQ